MELYTFLGCAFLLTGGVAARTCVGGTIESVECDKYIQRELSLKTGGTIPGQPVENLDTCGQCAALCKSNPPCVSFNLNVGKKICTFFATNQYSLNHQLSTNSEVIYGEINCACQGEQAAFDCKTHDNKELHWSGAAATGTMFSGIESCMQCGQLCLSTEACKSVNYDRGIQKCTLLENDRFTAAYTLVPISGKVYAEVFCDNSLKCPFFKNLVYKVTQGQKLTKVGTLMQTHTATAITSLEACKKECTTHAMFRCLSLNYKAAAPTECVLNSLISRDQTSTILVADVAYVYAEATCTAAGVTCSWALMFLVFARSAISFLH